MGNGYRSTASARTGRTTRAGADDELRGDDPRVLMPVIPPGKPDDCQRPVADAPGSPTNPYGRTSEYCPDRRWDRRRVARILLGEPTVSPAGPGGPFTSAKASSSVTCNNPGRPSRANWFHRHRGRHSRPAGSRHRRTDRRTGIAGKSCRFLAAGKQVVTANKALLAEHGPEVFEAARAERAVGFEAAWPAASRSSGLAESLAANQVTAIQGILNGTSNFILTAMADRGVSYADALAEAQQLGYAEADPTLDVDGSDAAHKLAILAQIAFGVTVPVKQIERFGIADLHAMDLRFAQELGYTIKLLAEAWLDGREVALHVAPVLLRRTDMLAQVRGAFNAVQVVGDAVGEVMFQGPGAGALPTASSVVADVIDLAVGRAQRTFQAMAVEPGARRYAPAVSRCAVAVLSARPGQGRTGYAGRRGPGAGERGDQHCLGDPARGGRGARGRSGAAGHHDALRRDRPVPDRPGHHEPAEGCRPAGGVLLGG